MRFFERLMYILGLCLAFTYGFEEFLGSFIVVCLILITSFIGAIVEGLRFTQWIFLVAFIPHIVLVVMDVYSIIALVIYCSFLTFSILASFIFGEANFNRLKMVGEYQVGHKDYFTRDGISVSIFYPMDRGEYDKTINLPGKNSYWFRHGFKSRLGLTKATAEWEKENHPNPWFYKYLDDIKMDTVQNGEIADIYKGPNAKKIIPVVFLHGLTGSQTTQTGTCRDLASHGHIVFTLAHFDGTANYAVKKDGSEKFWSSMHDVRDIELRREQIKIRKTEVRGLIDDISEEKFAQELFNKEVTLDLDKLICAGHSFGGMNAIASASEDTRIKAVFTFDPWLYVVHEAIKKGEFSISQPQCHVLSEGFSPVCEEWFYFNTVEVLDKLMQNSPNSDKAENIILKQINHYHQCDAIVLVPLESFLKSCNRWQTNVPQLYLLNSQVALKFLQKQGFSHLNRDLLDIQIQKLKKHVEYAKEYKPIIGDDESDIQEERDDDIEKQQLIKKES